MTRAEENRKASELFTAYTGFGTVLEAMGDNKKAEEYFLKAVNLTEELRSTLPKAQRETFFDVRINGFLRTAPYDGLARVRIKMNRPPEAFKDSEYTKSRIFAEAMSKMVGVHQLRYSSRDPEAGSGTQRSACGAEEEETRSV